MHQIPIILLDSLVITLQEILKDMEFIKPSKSTNDELVNTSINVYKQNRSILEAGQRLEEQIPFVQVQFDTGSKEADKIIFGIVVYDDNSDNQGYVDAINIANKILNHFNKNRTIEHFECDIETYKYQILEEVEHPYYAIALELDFKSFEYENELETEGLI